MDRKCEFTNFDIHEKYLRLFLRILNMFFIRENSWIRNVLPFWIIIIYIIYNNNCWNKDSIASPMEVSEYYLIPQ